MQEARNAGVWVFGASWRVKRTSIVATDGTVTDGPYPETKEVLGGLAVVDVLSRAEALEWAAKISVVCRCPQEVRELLPDPTARSPSTATDTVIPLKLLLSLGFADEEDDPGMQSRNVIEG